MRRFAENLGRDAVAGLAELGQATTLLAESLLWTFFGATQRQPVRFSGVLSQAMEAGIHALPIVFVLSMAIGAMVAIQGIYSLSIFGAESKVTLGVALSVTREFAPLITGVLVAGRSGSALAARLGMMTINQEIDALTVMGINPVRFLVAPALLAMILMLPLLTWFADCVGLFGAGLYVTQRLGMSATAYINELRQAISVADLMHGIGKSGIFAVLITMVGVINGIGVVGGADGIGRATTRAVVHGISAIVIVDMLFAYLVLQ
ncbi:MAG: ABC transporter permease [Nevskia sp.]|jgi:phospholipid/cholesterol/gamma-HCH transport system permease protein|nr:ABC transporter permease [Nevskia sp.]MCK9385377.1 ABC transporter permease [Nevskia sp.]